MTLTPVSAQQQQQLWNELMQFYINEAWMLDERRLEEWLDLLTEDSIYFMPRRKNVNRKEIEREYTGPRRHELLRGQQGDDACPRGQAQYGHGLG